MARSSSGSSSSNARLPRLSFRMDEGKQRIFVHSGDRHVFGFEVDTAAALDALGAARR